METDAGTVMVPGAVKDVVETSVGGGAWFSDSQEVLTAGENELVKGLI